ncbi:hypothetical protein HDU67_000144 [Dinochytrium kinnereticum]|nr:hypothetical protein HDU67_000144 [Dinochytrium kinnereticum]
MTAGGRPVPSPDNSFLDGFPFRSIREEQARAHPRASAIPQGIPIELIHSILFGLVLTDAWNHPDSSFVPDRGYCFTTLPVSDQKASLREGDELVQALLMSMAVYEPNPVAFLSARKSYHQCIQVVSRRFEHDEGYLVGLQPPASANTRNYDRQNGEDRSGGSLGGGGRAFIAFTGTKDWKHVKEALSFLPGTLNGMPTLSNLGCHSGYLSVAEQIPDLIGALQQQNYTDIILCGHSRGGALAHLVLLLHLYRNDSRDDPSFALSDEQGWGGIGPLSSSQQGASPPKNSVRAFAFGAPFVINESVSAFLADRNLHHRFLSVVNDGDVIPGVMSTLGGLSAADVSSLGTKAAATWVGVDVDGILRTIGPLLGAATGYPIPAAVGATVGGLVWNSFWTGFVSSPVLTYRPIGKYVFLRKKYGSETRGRPGELKLYGSSVNVPGEWQSMMDPYGLTAKTSYISVMEEIGPVLAPDAISPSITNIIGQQVLLPAPATTASKDEGLKAAPRKVKLDILGSNLDLLDMKEGILLERYFVDPVRLHSVVARTKDKMVVEVTIDTGIEKLPGRSNTHGPVVVFKSVHDGAKPIVKRLTSMTTVDAAYPTNGALSPHFPGNSTLADGTVFDVAINAFKRAVINRSHELRAAAMGFTAHPEVQERLSEVKSAFDRLEALCPLPGAAATSISAGPSQASSGAPTPSSSAASLQSGSRMGSAADLGTPGFIPGRPLATSQTATGGTYTSPAGTARSPRPLSQLIEILARIDAFPDADLSFATCGVAGAPLPMEASLDPVTGIYRNATAGSKEEQDAALLLREREISRIVAQTMEEATSRCNSFLRTVCSRIDVTLEPSVYFVVGSGVVTGLVTALSIGLLLPEAPVIAAGIGMGFLTSTAVGPLGLGDTVVVRAAHRELDNQYRFLLMELVKWVGVSNADNAGLEFLNAYTHERAIEDRLLFQGFQAERPDLLDPARWMCWDEDREEVEEFLLSAEETGKRGTPDRVDATSKKKEVLLQVTESEKDSLANEKRSDGSEDSNSAPMDVDVPNPWKDAASSPLASSTTIETGLESALASVKVSTESRKSPKGPTPRRHGSLLNEDLFGPGKTFDRATRASLAAIAKRIDMVRQIHRIRRLIVEETVVALVGTQDAGKTTAARRLFPHVEREFPASIYRRHRIGETGNGGGGKGVIRRGMFEHTSGVRMFPQGRLVVADFPGSDSTALSLDQCARRYGSVASVALLLCHFNGDASGEVLRNLEEIKEWSSRIPILLCIHQAGNKVNSDPNSILYHDELTSPDDVDRFILRWADTIRSRFPNLPVNPILASHVDDDSSSKRLSTFGTPGSTPGGGLAPGVTIVMTEFAKELGLCHSFGIWGVREVRGWVRERIAEGNAYIDAGDLLEVLPDEDS